MIAGHYEGASWVERFKGITSSFPSSHLGRLSPERGHGSPGVHSQWEAEEEPQTKLQYPHRRRRALPPGPCLMGKKAKQGELNSGFLWKF